MPGRSERRRFGVALVVGGVLLNALVLAALTVWHEGRSPWAALGALGRGDGSGVVFPFVLLSLSWWGLALAAGLLRRFFGVGYGVVALARGVVDQALSLRGMLVPVGFLLFLLSVLPVGMDASTPLRYRVQSYLAYAIPLTALFLSCSTVLFACRNVTAEMGSEGVGDLFVKPVGRGAYVLAKCLGLASVNFVLVFLCALLVYSNARFHLGASPPLDALDADVLEQDVLVARRAVGPQVDDDELRQRARDRLADLEAEEPGTVEDNGGAEALLEQFVVVERSRWGVLAPAGAPHPFIFEELQGVRQRNVPFQLRFRVQALPFPSDGKVRLLFRWGDQQEPVVANVGRTATIPVPPSAVDEQGRLVVFVEQQPSESARTAPTSVSFPIQGGLLVLFPWGTFGGNLARAFAASWVRLVFLGALAVFAASFLSFPVASLLALVLWMLSALGSALVRLLEQFPPGVRGLRLRWFHEEVLFPVMGALGRLVRQYSVLDAGNSLVEGVYVSGGDLVRHALWIGCAWTGMCALAAWGVLRNREIARVQV